jgi:phosphoribosylformimino-5-aminoimidazole carboxamide ribotide isomerase
MQLYPAIDLRRGQVVRLSQGDDARTTVYDADPVAQAERFADAGAAWLHVVDLDRAFGDGDSSAVVRAITARVGARLRVQTGGGIRSVDAARAALAAGASRVVIGTAAVSEPALVPAAIAAFGADAVAVGIDAKDGCVAVKGWTETSPLTAAALAERVREAGVRTIVHTDIGRDGMLVGPDVDGSAALAALGLEVIASGGVGTLDHLRAVAARGLAGAIVGRALYERRFTLEEALACVAGAA